MSKKTDELRAAIKAKREEYQAKFDKVPGAELRAITEDASRLSAELTAEITKGAEPCEGCQNHPHGMVQEVAIKNRPVSYFEIGCLVCPDKRAQGFTEAQAVDAWNAENYIAPKKRDRETA